MSSPAIVVVVDVVHLVVVATATPFINNFYVVHLTFFYGVY